MIRNLFFTDPHLGKSLASHTTLDSRKRLQTALFQQAFGVLTSVDAETVTCLGDLFDRYQNHESTLLQGLKIVSRCNWLMAGNHDVVADVQRLGTLETLRALGAEMPSVGGIVMAPFGEVRVEYAVLDQDAKVGQILIPHHTTDALFEDALKAASDYASEKSDWCWILGLHCNYDSPFVKNDVTLNLPAHRAEQLLEHFAYILIGHDHNPKEDFDGRVIVLGNTHPTGFGDMSDKRVALFDTDTKTFTFETIWRKETGYLEIDAEDLLALGVDGAGDAARQFVRVTGTINADQALEYSRVLKALWNADQPPFAIRSDVHLQQAGAQDVTGLSDATNAWDMICSELREAGRSDLLEIMEGLDAAKADIAVEE